MLKYYLLEKRCMMGLEIPHDISGNALNFMLTDEVFERKHTFSEVNSVKHSLIILSEIFF